MRYVMRVAVLAMAVAGVLMSAATALAATAPGYEEFDDCPGRGVNADISLCAVTKVSGGHLQMGSKTVPITDPITLAESVAPPANIFVGRFDGGRQVVPGGLVGITGLDWLTNVFPATLLKLYARSELAGTPSNPIQDPVTLPLKVRLESPLLSNNCYVGSNADPIVLNLTQHATNPPPPNQPINGTPGNLIADPVLPNVFRLEDAVVVDNAFAAPRARGCTLLLPGLGLIDPIVNLQAGLPSPAGTNEAVQHVDVGLAEIQSVYPPDGIE
jgi:hypothetical protein